VIRGFQKSYLCYSLKDPLLPPIYPMPTSDSELINMGNQGIVPSHVRARSGPVNLLQSLPSPTPRTYSTQKVRITSSRASTDVIRINVRKRSQVSFKVKTQISAPITAIKKQAESDFAPTPELVRGGSLFSSREGLGRSLRNEKRYRLMRQGSRTSSLYEGRRSPEETKDHLIRPLPELQAFRAPNERQAFLFSEIPSVHEKLVEHQPSLQLHAIPSPAKMPRVHSFVSRLHLTKEL
jgi:hypothetical protein